MIKTLTQSRMVRTQITVRVCSQPQAEEQDSSSTYTHQKHSTCTQEQKITCAHIPSYWFACVRLHKHRGTWLRRSRAPSREGRTWLVSSFARRASSLPKVDVSPLFTLRAVVPGADRASSGRRSRATPRPSALGGQTRPRACALRPERAARAAPAQRAQHLRERRPARWDAG